MKDRSILDNSMELNAEERFNQFKRDFELRMRQEIAEEVSYYFSWIHFLD